MIQHFITTSRETWFMTLFTIQMQCLRTEEFSMSDSNFPTEPRNHTIKPWHKIGCYHLLHIANTTLLGTTPLHIHQRNFVDDIFYP